MALFNLTNHVAIVTGANHGIGAATARILSECGARVLVTYLRLRDTGDPGLPESYRRSRASGADNVIDEIRSKGCRTVAEHSDPMRIAEPEEVARVIAYLASDEARLITGNVLRLR